MKKEHVLAGPLPLRVYEDDKHDSVFTVFGGLQYIKGNSLPYFSLTCWYKGRSGEGGGAAHELILKYFPQFADLAALHLSDINGVPMHASGNGMYWLAGAMGNPFGERYHGGNREYGDTSPDACLKIFADHVRVSLEEAKAIADQVKLATLDQHDNRRAYARDLLTAITNAMLPRWKREAEACIAKHALVVYGDEWKPEEAR